MESKRSDFSLVSKAQWLFAISTSLLLFAHLATQKFGSFNPDHRLLVLIIFALSYPVYSILNVYTLRAGLATNAFRLISAWLVLLSILALLGFITKTSARFSREAFLLWATIGLVIQLAILPLQLKVSKWILRRITKKNRLLIVGSCKLIDDVISKVKQIDSEVIVGILSLDESKEDWQNLKVPILTEMEKIGDYLGQYNISKIYLALARESPLDIKNLYIELLDKNIDIIWVPDLSDILLIHHSVDDLLGLPIIRLSESPLTANLSMWLVKDFLDKALALIMLAILSPLLIAVCLLIKISSKGPIIYRQQRHGLNGKPFFLYKFRSMRVEHNDVFRQATINDDRITPIGKFLRKTSIDELPQLINVLKGDMSLVGPRPHAVEMNDYYSKKIQAYMARHRIRPGITGLAQIRGFRGETDTMDKMERRFESDLEYVNNWSLLLDLKIILRTPMALLSDNAY